MSDNIQLKLMNTIEVLEALRQMAQPVFARPACRYDEKLDRDTVYVFHEQNKGQVVATFSDEVTALYYIKCAEAMPSLLDLFHAAEKLIEMPLLDDVWRDEHAALKAALDAAREAK